MTGRRPPRSILLCGLPGSGKTALAGTVAAVRPCPDGWMTDLGIELSDSEGESGST